MQFDVRATTLAAGIGTAITWITCNVLTALAPNTSMTIMANMFHTEPSKFAWSWTWAGFLLGLVGWSLTGALLGWLSAALYNRLSRPGS